MYHINICHSLEAHVCIYVKNYIKYKIEAWLRNGIPISGHSISLLPRNKNIDITDLLNKLQALSMPCNKTIRKHLCAATLE